MTGTTPIGAMVTSYSDDLLINLEVKNYCPEFPPIWMPNLIDQSIEKGKSLKYRPVIEVIENRYEYNLKVHMNIVATFGSY